MARGRRPARRRPRGAAFDPGRQPPDVSDPVPRASARASGRPRPAPEGRYAAPDADRSGRHREDALAIQAAFRLAYAYLGGVWFVGLAGLTDPALVLSQIARDVGVSERPDRTLLEAIAERFQRDRALLVIDNVEQLLPDAAEPIADLCNAAPSLDVVVSSREPLRVSASMSSRRPAGGGGGHRPFRGSCPRLPTRLRDRQPGRAPKYRGDLHSTGSPAACHRARRGENESALHRSDQGPPGTAPAPPHRWGPRCPCPSANAPSHDRLELRHAERRGEGPVPEPRRVRRRVRRGGAEAVCDAALNTISC